MPRDWKDVNVPTSPGHPYSGEPRPDTGASAPQARNTLGQSETQPHTKQRGVQSMFSRVRSGNSPFSGMALGRRAHEI